jgi:hypothetical protein
VNVLFTVCGADQSHLQRWLGEPVMTPFEADARWLAVGYDVCDSVLISGLLNCGYADPAAKAPFKNWEGALNHWHLFDRASDALPYAAATGVRVSEHQPFGVFRLYIRVAESSGGGPVPP